MKNTLIRKWLLISWLAILFSGIVSLFWYNEFIYSLPTPVPLGYQPVKQGKYVDLKGKVPIEKDKPLFLHFFNPKCPCSKFNIPHIESLVRKYGDEVKFVIVVQTKDKSYSKEDIQEKFDLKIPVLFDQDIAPICGVYATPQAVILDKDQKLYYRGNYNKSRYCTDKQTYFAQIALESLLNNKNTPFFNELASISYGCKLPMCKK